MSRKYRPSVDDYFDFAFLYSVHGYLMPIEDKLRAGGYTGPILADYDNSIYDNLNIQKTTPLDFVTKMADAEKEGRSLMVKDDNFRSARTISREEEKEFRKYLKKIDNHLDLLIKNTPPEEYPGELAEMKYYKAYIRAQRVFGSRELYMDQLGFLINARAYDADMKPVKVGIGYKGGVSRELWRHVEKYYPYSEYRDAIIGLTNVACDYEENKEKNTFIEQMEHRENYRKALQNYLSACKALDLGEEEGERIAKLYIRDDIIKEQKTQDGPDKNIDYHAIIKRVEEQKKNKLPVDPEDQRIADDIEKKVNDDYKENRHKYDWCCSRFGKEVAAAGYETNEKDFTGNRGNKIHFPAVEAQINAIDMGWPVDELIHIQRLHLLIKNFSVKGKNSTPEMEAFPAKCNKFYDEKIKNKPYPSTEEGRRALYEEFYALGREATEYTTNNTYDENDQSKDAILVWDVFEKDLKKTMDKPLTFSEKIVLKQVQEGMQPALTTAGVNSIKNSIGTEKRFGHNNSSEFDRLQKAFAKFEEAFKADKGQFRSSPEHTLSPEALKILNELRDASRNYLKEKDKDEKEPEKRSTMGKNRYEGAKNAYLLANQLIKKNEEILEKKAKEKKEAENIKGRRETREAFFKADEPDVEKSIEFNIKRAGGEEQYNAMLEAEAREAAEKEQREPVTDEEKYERLIDSCRVKLDDPVSYENPEQNAVMQKRRIDNLAKMLAAIELQEAGKPFNPDDITKRGNELKDLYSMNILERVSETRNGPEELKNALTFKFRAVELKKNLEESLYEVGKGQQRNTYESQNKYQSDLAELLNKNQKNAPELTYRTRGIVDSINEIMEINLKDKTLVGLNSYKLRKANAKLMDAIVNSFGDSTTLNKDAFGPKLALDALAVLSTYTGCKAVTNKLLNKINNNMTDTKGNHININIENFTNDYGVKNSKNVSNANRARENANRVNAPANHR